MVLQIIKANPTFTRDRNVDESYLDIAEFFCDTIQGEGTNIGHPATFLRVQHCSQNCVWCDSREVWRFGNPYSFSKLFELMDEVGLPEKLRKGQHLVLTGGSPVRQQDSLIKFLRIFISRYGFKPYIEIENECTIMPKLELITLVDCWNNSPKLENSLNPKGFRYQPTILKKLSTLENSWFKFVVSSEVEWEEIKNEFLDTDILSRDQIILMPLGATREELFQNRESVIEIAIRESVRYCSREHIVVWDKMTGI